MNEHVAPDTSLLGSIPLVEYCSVREARRKLRSLTELVSSDALLATRVATVVSEVGRALQRINSQARIDVSMCTRSGAPTLLLDFCGHLDDQHRGHLHKFFDQVESLQGDSGSATQRATMHLPLARVDGRLLNRLREIV